VSYEYGDLIWFTENGNRKPGMVVGTQDGFEYEIVHSRVSATTAHVTQLEPRDG